MNLKKIRAIISHGVGARSSILALTLFFVISCAAELPPVETSLSAVQRSVTDYFLWVSNASAGELEAEHERIERMRHSTEARYLDVQQALLLSVPENATAAHEEQAVNLLQSFVYAADSDQLRGLDRSGYREFAIVWLNLLEQRNAARNAQLDYENARDREQSLQEENLALSARIESLREQNRSLEEQIEALKSIEQQINQRELMRTPE